MVKMLKSVLNPVLLLLLFCFQSWGQTGKTIRYGGDSNYPPYEYLNSKGQPEGFNIDVMKAIAKEMDFKIEFVLEEWSAIRKELEETNNIDIADMFYSVQRDSIVDFSIPFTIAYDEIFVRTNSTGINTLDDIKDKKVIVQNLSFIYDKLIKLYPTAELIKVENEPEALKLLSQGVGDCAILSQTVTRTMFQLKNYQNIVRVGQPIFPKEYAFVVKEGNSELLRKINKGLVTLKDKKILDKIEDKWFGQKEEEYESIKQFLSYALYTLLILLIIVIGIIVWNRMLKKQVLIKTKKLIDTHNILTGTLENMDEGFYWINKDWIIININTQAASNIGKTPSEVLNKVLWDEFPQLKQYVFDNYTKAFKSNIPFENEVYFEQTSKWYENRVIPTQGGLAVFFKEITDKKNAEKLIKESESNLKSLIENWTEAIWAIDRNYKYIIFNEFYKQMFYNVFQKEISKGMSAFESLNEKEKEFWKSKYDEALSGQKVEFEISTKQDSIQKYYEVFLNPIVTDSTIKGVSAFRIDITNSKLREIQLTAAKEQAEKSEKLKTEFLAQISHEIRTPINNILNYTGLLLSECSEEENEVYQMIHDSIESSSKRIMRTIDLILNMSDIQLGSYNSIIKKIELISEIIKPVVQEYLPIAEKRSLFLKIETAHDIMEIEGDQYSLQQIFSNLIDNAIKYTNKGGVTILADITTENNIIVSVVDTGIGISEEFLPNLFEAFRQEEQGYTRSYEGNGLGLALVKKYCEINNATINVETSKSSGTRIDIIFPVSN